MTYDFEPVEPLFVGHTTIIVPVGEKLDKPDLFLVVDKSGSMNFGVDAPGCSCAAGGCPATCPTRWTELKAAMGPFLSSQGSVAHFGMVPFPPVDAQVCQGAVVSDIANYGIEVNRSADSDLAAMQLTADAVRAKIEAITPIGGTPTSASMSALLSYAPMVNDPNVDRPHFALLLTDGLPNCNAANDPIASTCTCTSAASPCTASGNNLCLDDSNTAAEIAKLRTAGITTIVLGFGAETGTGLGPATLNALAVAGGFDRRCGADSDCGVGDTCGPVTGSKCGVPMRACARKYFQAGNANELGSALDAIRNGIASCEQCFYGLGERRPSSPELLAVRLDGTSLSPNGSDGYVYDAPNNRIEIRGASCDALKNSTKSKPVQLEFRILEKL